MLANRLLLRRYVFSRWNPLDKAAAVTLSNGNKTADVRSSGSVRATKAQSSGVKQYEILVNEIRDFGFLVGLGGSGASINNYPGAGAGSFGYWSYNGQEYAEGVPYNYGVAFFQNDIIGIVANFSTGVLRYYKNGVDQGASQASILGRTLFPMVGTASTSSLASTVTINTGETPFAFPIAGATAWG